MHNSHIRGNININLIKCVIDNRTCKNYLKQNINKDLEFLYEFREILKIKVKRL